MLSFESEGGIFNYRVAAVISHNGRILLHQQQNDAFWTLPGGCCEFGEPSDAAAVREIFEETGSFCSVDRLLWTVENFFEYRGKSYHELLYIYRAALPLESMAISKDEFSGTDGSVKLRYKWMGIGDFDNIIIRPSFLKEKIKSLPEKCEHIIHSDEA